MSTEDLIEESNRQEVSRLKVSLIRYAKKWPWLLLSLSISLLLAYFNLSQKSNIYNVESIIQIKKSKQIEDPGDLLFSGRTIKRFSAINDESVIIKSYPLVRSVVEDLNLELVYFIEQGFKTREIYQKRPFQFQYDRAENQQIPNGVQFEINFIDEERFEIKTERPFQEILLDQVAEFDQEIKLGTFSFKIIREAEYKFEKEASYFVSLNSIERMTYSYRAMLNFSEGDIISNLLTLSIKTSVPEKAIHFMNGLIERYTVQNLKEKNEVASNTLEFIDGQLAIISDSLNTREQSLADFRAGKSIESLSSEGSALLMQFNEIESQKAKFELMQKYYDYLQDKLFDEEGQNLENLIAPSAFGIEDLVVNELVKNLVDLNLIRSKMIEDGNTKSPLLKQVESNRTELIHTLDESIKNLSKANKMLLADLNSRTEQLNDNAQELPATQLKLVNLNRLLKLNEKIYLFLMEKRSTVAITKSSNTPDCKVVEPPMLNPIGPIAPKRRMYYMIATLLGLALPILFFIVLDFLSDTIRDKEDILTTTDIPLMGIIPNSRNMENSRIVFNKPKSALAESFRTIRTNLTFFQQKKSPFVIMLTSTVAKEGKSFCSINLAASLAASGKRTVLLGFDMRKPQIHNYMNLEDNTGISNYLSGNAKVEDLLIETEQPSLFVIGSGPIPPNPAELISTPATSELLAELKRQFDYIIIDTPPIGLVADALLLQQESDLNLYVIRQNYSKREFLNQINDFKKTSKLKNLSLILNDVRKEGSNSYGYYEEDSKKSNKRFLGFS